MTPENLAELALDLASKTKEFVARRIAPLEARIAALESGGAKARVKFRGGWSPSVTYFVDDAALHGGRLFVCTSNHTIGAEPGAGGVVVWRQS
jgi:hypothetical protein